MNTPLHHALPPQNAAAQDPSAARRRKNNPCNCDGDDKVEVEKKIAALQKIVPGGERLAVEELFEETADYIFALENKVKALRFLTAFVQSSENRKRKLGA